MAESGTFYPAVTADNGMIRSDGTYNSGGTYMYVGLSGTTRSIWVRFPNFTITRGSTITTCRFRLTSQGGVGGSGNVEWNVYFNDHDDAVVPASKVDYDNKAVTGAIAWDYSSGAWVDDTQYDSPELKTILQTIVDRGGFASGQAVMVLLKDDGSAAFRQVSTLDYDAGSDKPELYVEWVDANINVEATTAPLTITPNAANVNAETSFTTTVATLTIAANAAEVVPGTLVSASLAELTITPNAATVTTNIEILATSVSLTITANAADVFVGILVDATLAELTITSNSAGITVSPVMVITENLMLYDELGWAWGKVLTDTVDLADTVTPAVAIPVEEILTLKDAVHNNWTGTEVVESGLMLIGELILGEIFNETATSALIVTDAVSYLHQMISVISETIDFADAAGARVDFNPVIAEAIALNGIVGVLTNLHNSVEESLSLTDEAGFAWSETVEETLDLADTVSILWHAMCALTDNIDLTEVALGQFQFDDTLTDTINLAASVAMQRVLQETITETIDFGITIELDGELWETWVLNTNAFHASVYSGYDFNSYAVYNDAATGCKTDGIYLLDGDTDDGAAFKTGLVLPESRFGTPHFKRFRKAYFGLAGGTTPAIKMENEDGTSNTYTIANSKATPTRGVKGRRWTLSVQDFDSLDFIELVPLWLVK